MWRSLRKERYSSYSWRARLEEDSKKKKEGEDQRKRRTKARVASRAREQTERPRGKTAIKRIRIFSMPSSFSNWEKDKRRET